MVGLGASNQLQEATVSKLEILAKSCLSRLDSGLATVIVTVMLRRGGPMN